MTFSELHKLIRAKVHKIRNYYNRHGLWKSVLHFFDTVGCTFKYRELIFFELRLQDAPSCQENDSGIELVRVRKEDIENAQDYYDGWFSREQALKRLDEGHALLVVNDEGKMIFFQWIELRKAGIPHIDISFSIPERTAYMAYIYTLPKYRGRAIATRAKRLVMKYLKENGYGRTFMVTAPDNVPSMKVNSNAGLRQYQAVTYWRLLFLKYYCVRDLATNRRRVSLRITRTDNQLWKAFSKIG